MRSSVQTGVAAIGDRCDAFFLMLLDQPLIRPQTLQRLSAHWPLRSPPIVMPSYQSKHGHPLLISAACAPDILALRDSATLHDFVNQHRISIEVLDVDDSGVVTDLDTPADYRAMRTDRPE
jgi:CTP:molybdopterin cytidylyltransferase MocA